MGHALPCLVFQVRGEVRHLPADTAPYTASVSGSGALWALAARGLEDVVDVCSRQVPLLHLLQGLLQPPSGPGRQAIITNADRS